MTRNRPILLLCSLAALLGLILLFIFGQDIGSFIDSKSICPKAVYNNFELNGYSDRFTKLLIGDPVRDAKIYAELPDKQQLLLSELSEKLAGQLMEDQYSRPVNITVYSTGHTFLKYLDGKLVFVSLEYDSCPFRISPNKDGPYVKLPISRETLLEVFGEPLRWEKAPRPPSGP